MNISDRFSLKGKVAVITGASKGIGEAIAYIYSQYGAKVVVSSRKQEAVDKVAQQINQSGEEAIGIACNTGKVDDLQHLIKETISHFGHIDILVNNAAANPVFGPVLNTDESAFNKIMDVNLKGPFELCKLVHPEMKKRGGGAIINISSIGGISPEPMLGIYSVSKAALISLTKVLAREWGQDGIRVNTICPGLIKTKFSEPLWNNEKIMHSMMKKLPISKIGMPEEIASLALFLASEASSYSTGGIFTSDGGYTI